MNKVIRFYVILALILGVSFGIYGLNNYQEFLANQRTRLQRQQEVSIQTDKFYGSKVIALLDVGVDWDNSELQNVTKKETCFSSSGDGYEAICKEGDYVGAGQNCKDKSLTSNCSQWHSTG